MDNTDLEGFARFVGSTGVDFDLFYEMYYGLDNEQLEEEIEEDCHLELPGHYCILRTPLIKIED